MDASITNDNVYVDPTVAGTMLLKYCPVLIVPMYESCTVPTALESREGTRSLPFDVQVEICGAQDINDVNT